MATCRQFGDAETDVCDTVIAYDAGNTRAKVSLALPDPERIVDILPDHPATATIALPDYASLWDTPMFETALVDASPITPLPLGNPLNTLVPQTPLPRPLP